MLDFALNQVTMAATTLPAFLANAEKLGCHGVELRNDLARPIFDGLPVKSVRDMLQDHDLKLLGLSQIYPCNRWSTSIATESQTLIASSVELGAEAINLIPCNDGTRLSAPERLGDLKRGLEALLPLLNDAGMTAYLEPLGFARASLRHKSEAVDVIQSIGASETIKIVHDTFHHALAQESALYPSETGIVHISGVTTTDLPLSDLADDHRVLVDQNDRLDNLGQITALLQAGYSGPFSFECFAPSLQTRPTLTTEIRQSIEFITAHLQSKAA